MKSGPGAMATGVVNHRDGFATPMRGKSPTCRTRYQTLPVFAPKAVVDRPMFLTKPFGKSKTCRASAWQSHKVR